MTNLRSQNGNAMLETLPLLAVFVILVGFGLGLFGAIHTGILYSIGARTYAFETFRNRTNLTFHREDTWSATNPTTMRLKQVRFHLVTGTPENVIEATARPIAVGTIAQQQPGNVQDHNVKVFNLPTRNQNLSLNPIWIMVGYGICLNAICGDSDTGQGGS